MRRAPWLAGIAAWGLGCGRWGFDHAAPDAADAAAAADAAGSGSDAVAVAACDWRQGVRLSPPELLATLSLANTDEVDPVLSPDGVTLYFSSDRGGNDYDVFEATRASPQAAFAAPTPSSLVNRSARDEYRLGLTPDLLTAYVSSARLGGDGGGVDIWMSVRTSPIAAFPALQPAVGVNTSGDDHDPDMGTGHELWLAQQLGATDQDIYVATRVGDAITFSTPALVTELSSQVSDADPSLSADGLRIVFSSVRGGTQDLWYALRDDVGQPFGPAMVVPGVNDPGAQDGDPSVSANGCELVFSSDRIAGTNQRDLYRAVFVP